MLGDQGLFVLLHFPEIFKIFSPHPDPTTLPRYYPQFITSDCMTSLNYVGNQPVG
jgi:hypothetical protein